eukprot:409184-Rhodomonas_salina.6
MPIRSQSVLSRTSHSPSVSLIPKPGSHTITPPSTTGAKQQDQPEQRVLSLSVQNKPPAKSDYLRTYSLPLSFSPVQHHRRRQTTAGKN